MTLRKMNWLVVAGTLIFVLAVDPSMTFARGGRGGGGGGGGFRGGGGGGRSYGGGSRPSYSGSGSVRYSSPSRSYSGSSSYSRPSTPSYSRPSTPSYSRPSSPSYVRPSTPTASPRPAGGSMMRPTTPSSGYRSSLPSSGYRPTTPSYLPSNRGSLVHSGSITTPGGSTIGGVQGPRGGGAVGIQGPGGGSAGAIRGPGGGGAAAIQGPGGGTAGAVRGPGGGAAAGVVGPGGGAAGAVRGPGGAGAAGVRGPGGAAAGAVWGPGGYGVAGARGPYGNRYVTNLPNGAIRYPWGDVDYWHVGFSWYTPNWVGDDVYYGWAYPPTGYYYPSLPTDYNTTVINNTTYYESDGVYYQEGQQGGQSGYVVVEAPRSTESAPGPAEAEASKGTNPFEIFKGMCDFLANQQQFSMAARTTSDEVLSSGKKVQLSARRLVDVSRPDKLAIEASSDSGDRRSVYDGKTITILHKTKKLYTAVEVPNTIEGAFDTMAEKYGLVFPLKDLLYKDLYDRVVTRISAGQYLGLHTVDSVKCHHLAFTSDEANCEIWIDAGSAPVPRKFSIDYAKNTGRTRFSAEIVEWRSSPTFTPATFELKLPEDVKRFELKQE